MKLSIITINYNNCEGLRKTIESVVNQTWQEFEWIIVDGGSTDGSRELIEETAAKLANEGTPASPSPWHVEQFSLLGFTAEDWKNGKYPSPASREPRPRTLLWTSEKDNGIYNAMNKGIVMAQGEYYLFLNSGDWLHTPIILSIVFKTEQDTDYIIGNTLELEGNVWKEKKYIPKQGLTTRILYKYFLPHQASFMSRNLFERFGYYEEKYRIVSDWKFMIETIVFERATVKHIPIAVSVIQDGGISAISNPIHNNEREEIIDKLFPPMIRADYEAVCSLNDVTKNPITKFLYSLLYRFADIINKTKTFD